MIPAKNEASNISFVLDDIKKHFDSDILVVDDNSIDNTYTIAKKKGVYAIKLFKNLGAWGAINAGFKYAKRKHYDIVITMDADGQHLGQYLQSLVFKLNESNADVVIGSYPDRLTLKRKFVIKFFRIITGLSFNDLTSGFRAYSKKAYEFLSDSSYITIDYQDIGVLLLCKKMGFKIVETNVKMLDRLDGKSRVFASYLNVVRYIIYSLLWSIFRR